MPPPPPRLFGIPATEAPVVAVLRRGPSSWWQVGRWDVDALSYQPGSWVRGTVYPQRCDLSPDGRWLCYFTLTGRAGWSAGGTYVAVSRLPWATALAAWGTGGTWTRGMHFVGDRATWELGAPDEGDDAPCRARYGLAFTRPASYAVERRRGWTETGDSPPASEHDPWDERRAHLVTMRKPAPAGGPALLVTGAFAAFRSFDVARYGEPTYRLDGPGGELPGVQWADWSADGRLLVATADGRLQVRSGVDHAEVRWEADLAGLVPDPQPPPAEAHRW